MDQIVNMIVEKTGIPADKAQQAVGVVMDFLGDKLPGPIAGQVKGLLGGEGGGDMGDMAGGAMDSVKKGLGGLLGG